MVRRIARRCSGTAILTARIPMETHVQEGEGFSQEGVMKYPLPVQGQKTIVTTARHGQVKKNSAILDRMAKVHPADRAVWAREMLMAARPG